MSYTGAMPVRGKAIAARVEADDAKDRGSDVERKTTFAMVRPRVVADPFPPPGPGWIMEGAAVDNGVAYWFWARWP